MVASTRAQLTTEVSTNFPDNTSGLITPAISRTTFGDFIASFGTLADTNTFAPASGVAITITGPANTNTAALNINQSGPTSGTVSGPVNLNLVTISGYNAATTGVKFADFGAWSSSVVGSRVNFTVGGASVTSGTEPFMAMLGHIRVTTATAASNVDFEGVTGISYTNVSIGGTMEGVVGAIVVDNGGSAAFVAGVFAEADILTGGTSTRRYGIWIDSEGFLTASGDDAAIGIGSIRNAASFKNAIVLNTTGGGVPIQTTGSILTSTAAFTIANAFDLTNATITGNVLTTPNVQITGAGTGNFGPNVTPTAGVKIIANKNTVAAPLIFSANSVTAQFIGPDSTLNRVALIAPNGIPVINFVTSQGTLASPSAVLINQFLGAFGAFGYGATGYGTTGGGAILFRATEAWSDTAMGANVLFQTTPNTTTATVTALTIQNSGGISIGTSTDGGIGSVLANTSIKSQGATAGIGYATGAGSAQTQGSSRTTTVTINTICGAITLFSAAGSATPATFTVSNSAVAATDTVVVSQKSGTDKYEIFVTAVGSSSFNITFFTTGGTTTEQPVFNFVVIKAVAA